MGHRLSPKTSPIFKLFRSSANERRAILEIERLRAEIGRLRNNSERAHLKKYTYQHGPFETKLRPHSLVQLLLKRVYRRLKESIKGRAAPRRRIETTTPPPGNAK